MNKEIATYISSYHFYFYMLEQLMTTTTVALVKKMSKHRRQHLLNKLKILVLLEKSRFITRGPIKIRSRDWWENVVASGKFGHYEWLENFRMSRETFQIICNELKDELAPKPDGLDVYWRLKRKLTVEKKVAVALYYLASCCEYRVVANQFGIHKSTVCKVVHEFVKATNKVLAPKYVKFPNQAEATQYAEFFKAKSHIPNIIGAIDGTHIPILPPSVGYRDYINRKGWASMVLQGVVDPSYKFLDVSIKQPGRCHDMAVFVTSNLYKNIQQVMPEGSVNINGTNLPWILVGDPAYPILPWLLKGFSGPNLTQVEDSFNVHLNSARVAVEIAFGRLKSRWRCLLKRLDIHYSFVPQVVATCCVLHNIVETYKDDFPLHWLETVQEAELIFQQPGEERNMTRDNLEGYNLRLFLAEYLNNNFPLRSSLIA